LREIKMDTYAHAIVEIDGDRKEMDVEEALVEGEGEEGTRTWKRRFNSRKGSKRWQRSAA
jgi:hypothetical protein